MNQTGNRMFHVLRADVWDALGFAAPACLSARDVRLHRFFFLVLASACPLSCSLATMLHLSVAFAYTCGVARDHSLDSIHDVDELHTSFTNCLACVHVR